MTINGNTLLLKPFTNLLYVNTLKLKIRNISANDLKWFSKKNHKIIKKHTKNDFGIVSDKLETNK